MNRNFDAGLRKLHLAHLDRDLAFAAMGVLGSVVRETDWARIRRSWRYPPNVVSIIVHDVPMSRGCGAHRMPPAIGPFTAGDARRLTA